MGNRVLVDLPSSLSPQRRCSRLHEELHVSWPQRVRLQHLALESHPAPRVPQTQPWSSHLPSLWLCASSVGERARTIMVSTRKLTLADIPALPALRREALAAAPWAFAAAPEDDVALSRDFVEQSLRSPTSFTFGAYLGEELVARLPSHQPPGFVRSAHRTGKSWHHSQRCVGRRSPTPHARVGKRRKHRSLHVVGAGRVGVVGIGTPIHDPVLTAGTSGVHNHGQFRPQLVDARQYLQPV